MADKVINKLLKTKLEEKNGSWIDELPGEMWAYSTSHKTTIGETPFTLAFGHETVMLAEIGVTMHRTEHFDESENNDQICLNLDLPASKRVLTYQ